MGHIVLSATKFKSPAYLQKKSLRALNPSNPPPPCKLCSVFSLMQGHWNNDVIHNASFFRYRSRTYQQDLTSKLAQLCKGTTSLIAFHSRHVPLTLRQLIDCQIDWPHSNTRTLENRYSISVEY